MDSNENKLLPMNENQCIPDGSGRNLTDVELQENVFNWIHEQWNNLFRSSRKLITDRDKVVYYEACANNKVLKDGFIFNNGCLVKVMHWINISLRRRTTVTRSVNEKVWVNGYLTTKGDDAKMRGSTSKVRSSNIWMNEGLS